MKSIKFPGANIEMAKDQPEYNSIHMKAIEGPEAEVIACYEFSDEELALIMKTKRLWYSRLRFRQLGLDDAARLKAVPQPMQPFRMWPVTENESMLIDALEKPFMDPNALTNPDNDKETPLPQG